jgi:hypothetical protein
VVGSGRGQDGRQRRYPWERPCHTWNAEEDIAESQVHLLLACRFDKSVDQRRRRAGEGQVPWPALTASGGVGLLGGLIGLGGAEFRLCSLVCLASRPCKP